MKKTRKIIVLLLSLVMLLASSVVVSAATAPSYAAPKGVTVIDSTSKNFAKTASLYTDEGAKTYDVKYTYTTKAFVKEGDLRNATLEDLAAMDIHEIVAPSISVSSDNTGALRASYSQVSDLATAKSVKYKSGKSTVTITYTVNGQITLTPVANSKKTVAVKVNYIQYSKGIQKIIAAKTLKVNTLTHAAGIDVTNAEQDEAGNYTLVMANKGTKSLGAVVSNDTASNKKLTYEVIGTKTAKGKNVEGVSVSAAGVVTTTGVALDKDLESTIKITSADKKASVTVSLKTATVDIAKIGFQSSKLALVTNEQDENYQGTVKVFAGRTVGKKTYYDVAIDSTKPTNEMVYVSSNPKVATVDENGVVTAVANGSAKISAYLKYNNSVKTGTVAVTVTTNLTNVSAKNVEVLVGKKVSPQVAINGGASSPITYKYSIVNVNPYEGDSIPVEASPTKANVTAAKAYLTIDKKGVITAKKPCQAQIKVEVKQGSKTPITATYNVAINPGVTSITPEINNVDSVVAVAKNSKGTKAAITISNAAQVKEYEIGANVAFNAAYTQAELEGANKEYIVTSSAPTVLRVYKNAEDKWVMVPMKSGSATIKFATTDGSGKSASVTASVVYKAFGITADTNAKVSDYSDLAALTALDNVTEETPVVLVSTKANKTGKIVVDPKTAINATVTNATAQNQAVKYYVNGSAVTSVTLDVNNNVGTKVVTAKSADNNASATYVIYRPSEAVIAGNGDVTVTPGDAVAVKVGETATAGYTLALNETEASASKNILSKGVTFKSENAKVATVTATGLVKGIAVGNTYIDVTYKSGLEAAGTTLVYARVPVYVGRTQASVETAVNNAIAAQANSQDFASSTGAAASYDSKKKTLTVSVQDLNRNITELQAVGVNSILTAIMGADFTLDLDSVSVQIMNGDAVVDTLKVEVNAEAPKYTVSLENGGKTWTAASYSELKSAMAEAIGSTGLNKLTWIDWVGTSLIVTTKYGYDSDDKVAHFAYSTDFIVDFTVTDAALSTEINSKLNAKVAEVNDILADVAEDDKLPVKESHIGYNEATQSFTAAVTLDKDMSVADAMDIFRTEENTTGSSINNAEASLASMIADTIDETSANIWASNAEVYFETSVELTGEAKSKLDSKFSTPSTSATGWVYFDGEKAVLDTNYKLPAGSTSLGDDVLDKLTDGVTIRDERGAVSEARITNAINRGVDKILSTSKLDSSSIMISDIEGITLTAQAKVTYKVGSREITKAYTFTLVFAIDIPEKEETTTSLSVVEEEDAEVAEPVVEAEPEEETEPVEETEVTVENSNTDAAADEAAEPVLTEETVE